MRTILIFVIVSLVMVSPVKAADYFPLAEGNQWSYSMSNGMQMTVKVTGFADVGGIRCAIVESDMGMQTSREYMALDTDGLKSYKAETMGQEIQYEKPVMRIKLPFVQGQSWTSSMNQFGMSITTTFESVGTERIETPTGNFECIVIRSSMSMPGQPPVTSDSYYADGKGLVRQTIQTSGQEMTVTLTSAAVKPAGQAPPTPKPASQVSEAQMHCPKCKAVLDADAKFCPQCGTKIVRPEIPTVCPKCNTKLPPGAKFCPTCGEKIALPAPGPQPAAKPVLEKYQSQNGTVMLYKPQGWTVEGEDLGEGAYAVMVMEPEENAVVVFISLFPLKEGITDSVSLAGICMRSFSEEIPDFKAKNVNSTTEKDRTIMDISFTDDGKKGVGHGYFFYTQRTGTVYLLLAREDLWDQLRPMMTNVASNIAYTPEGIANVAKQGRDLAAQTSVAQGRVISPAALIKQAWQQQGVQVPVRQASLPDQSMSVQIPQGWSIEGQKCQFLIADNARTRAHGMYSVHHTITPSQFSIPGVINAPYQPPPQALNIVLQFGRIGTELQIMGECPAEQAIPEFAQTIRQMQAQGFHVDARVVHVRFKNTATGVTSRGIFSVMCSTLPMTAIWCVAVDGSWAPDNEYDKWIPLYLRLGKSLQINKQWEQAEQRNQYYTQQRSNRRLQNSIAESNQAFDQYMDSRREADRSQDYISWMRSQTTLGQGSWVAENEGAHVYQTDSWGIEGPEGRIDSPAYNTTYFTGENPWEQEQLELVDTRAEYEKYIAN